MTRDVSASIEALGIDWGEQDAADAPRDPQPVQAPLQAARRVDTKDLLGHKTEQMSDLYADARGAEYKLVAVR
jgi:hypothetical protein